MNRSTKIALLSMLFMLAHLTVASISYAQPSQSLEAIKIATVDFEKRLIDEQQDWEYATYVSNIKNYSIGFAEGNDFYVVVFRLKPIKVRIFGNGAMYFINKRTMKIIKFVGDE